MWRTIGYAEIGPDNIGQNTNQNQVGKSSGSNVSCYLLLFLNCFFSITDQGSVVG